MISRTEGKIARVVALLASLATLAIAAAPAPARVPADYSLRAIGDSVTAGFGYCGTGDGACGAGQDHLMPVWSLLSCASGPLDGRCSSNYGNPRGYGSTTAWPARVAHHHGVQDFANVAVQGSTPADWDHGGELHSRLRDVVAANPRVVAMTLGANPILREFSRGKYAICSLVLGNAELRRCVLEAMREYRSFDHLVSVYSQVLANPRTQLVVSKYHSPVPSPAVALRNKVEVIIDTINELVHAAAERVNASFPGRVAMIAPDNSRWPLKHQCTAVQVATTAEWFFTLGRSGLTPGHGSTPWVLDNDFCTHPSAAGHEQFAHALGRVLPHGSGRARSKQELAETDDGTLEIKLDYTPVNIGHEHPRIRIHLNDDATLEVDARRDRCLAQEAVDPSGRPSCERYGAHHRVTVEGQRGWQEVTLPVWEGYFTVTIDARAADGQDATATATIVQRTRGHLLEDFEGSELERRLGSRPQRRERS